MQTLFSVSVYVLVRFLVTSKFFNLITYENINILIFYGNKFHIIYKAQEDTFFSFRHRRNVSREGENLEYLKNVVLQYMVSSDAESRQLMLNAIATILKFTNKELESVKKYNALWWWQPAPKSATPGKPSPMS